jgi:hypothetical protein
VNGCTGKMGLSVAEAAASRGLHLVPVSISSREQLDRTIQIGQIDVRIYGPSQREDVLSSLVDEFLDVIIVNYTTPDSVNCKQFNIAVFFHNMLPSHYLVRSWDCNFRNSLISLVVYLQVHAKHVHEWCIKSCSLESVHAGIFTPHFLGLH